MYIIPIVDTVKQSYPPSKKVSWKILNLQMALPATFDNQRVQPIISIWWICSWHFHTQSYTFHKTPFNPMQITWNPVKITLNPNKITFNPIKITQNHMKSCEDQIKLHQLTIKKNPTAWCQQEPNPPPRMEVVPARRGRGGPEIAMGDGRCWWKLCIYIYILYTYILHI